MMSSELERTTLQRVLQWFAAPLGRRTTAAVVIGAVFALAYYGFSRVDPATTTGAPHNAWDRVYASMQLFFASFPPLGRIDRGATPGGPPTIPAILQIARILAPIAAVGAVLGELAPALSNWLASRGARLTNNLHTIIVGSDPSAVALVDAIKHSKSHEGQAPVWVVPTPAGDRTQAAVPNYRYAVIGPLQARGTWRRAEVSNAGAIVCTSTDPADHEVIRQAVTRFKRRESTTLPVYLRVGDIADFDRVVPPAEGENCVFVPYHDLDLVAEELASQQRVPKDRTIAVVGGGTLADLVVAAILRRTPDQRLVVIGANAVDRVAQLRRVFGTQLITAEPAPDLESPLIGCDLVIVAHGAEEPSRHSEMRWWRAWQDHQSTPTGGTPRLLLYCENRRIAERLLSGAATPDASDSAPADTHLVQVWPWDEPMMPRSSRVEILAEVIHGYWKDRAIEAGADPSKDDRAKTWVAQTEPNKELSRDAAWHTIRQLAQNGYAITSNVGGSGDEQIDSLEHDLCRHLAELEHQRWCEQKKQQGFTLGHDRSNRQNPGLVRFTELPADVEEARATAERVGGSVAQAAPGMLNCDFVTQDQNIDLFRNLPHRLNDAKLHLSRIRNKPSTIATRRLDRRR